MQISLEASLKSNLILEFNNASKLFSREKLHSFEMISIQSHAFLTYQRDKKNNGWGLIMKPILGPLNVIIFIIKPPHYWDIGEDLETWWPFHGLHRLSNSAGVWVEPLVKHKVVEEAETLGPRTVAVGLSFKQLTRSALYLNQPQTPNYSLQFKQGLWAESQCIIVMGEMGIQGLWLQC